ncbi:MAG TPA: hypothetical protein VLG11_01155 [Candidatus Saccharimonadales bacterium]|nr:hypothetical protein [Candidatus Saccharimonadales bacterium]
MSELLGLNQNRIISGALVVAGLIGGVSIDTAAIGLADLGTKVWDLYEMTGTPDGSAIADCNVLPWQQVDATIQRLQEDFSPARRGQLNKSDAAAHAAELNVHLPRPEDLPTIYPNTSPSAAVKQLSAFTIKEYGFPVTSPSEQPSTTKDAIDLENAIASFPIELVKAAGVNGIELGADTELGASGGDGGYNPITQKITFAHGATKNIGHELTHAVASASAVEHCGTNAKFGDPNFMAVNPPEFSYDYSTSDIAWRGITADRYGATSAAEDEAVVGGDILQPGSDQNDKKKCAYGQSPILDFKVAAVTARFNDLAPGTGTYVADMMTTLAPCS